MSNKKNVVKDEELTSSQPSEGKTQEEPKTEDKVQPAPEPKEAESKSAPGSKTESELLLKSLQEERDKRRELEARQKELEEELENKSSDPTDDDVYSDEGKLLKKELDSVKKELDSFKDERELERVYTKYPQLKEKQKEFEEYKKDEHPRAKVESVAKLYLAEQGLLEPKRKGLESPTGGDRQPPKTGMTIEEVKHLRETNYKKYLQLLKKDQIKFE